MGKELSLIKCKWCGKEFMPYHPIQVYCSTECRTASLYERKKQERREDIKILKCQNCGGPITGNRKRKFCCEKCMHQYYYNHNGGLVAKKPRKKKEKPLSISEICKRAAEEHMSYGQYVTKYGL